MIELMRALIGKQTLRTSVNHTFHLTVTSITPIGFPKNDQNWRKLVTRAGNVLETYCSFLEFRLNQV